MVKLIMFRIKYQYLKVLIIDEILVMGRENFGQLDLALNALMQNSLPFGGVSDDDDDDDEDDDDNEELLLWYV